ncbi:MAG: PA domain-containing protein [Crocinitomicaceae bacterium]
MKKNLTLFVVLLFTFGAFTQQRVTLVETFTSSTCGPCNPGNIQLEGIFADPVNDDRYVSLKYQMNWPGSGDPYFTNEAGQRKNLYGISGIPTTKIDGMAEYNSNSVTQAHLLNAYAQAPLVNIITTYAIDAQGQTVDVSVDVEALTDLDSGLVLHVGIFEYLTANNIATNGETQFEHVLKKMLPNANGSSMPALTIGQHYYYDETYTFNGNYRLPNDASDLIDHTVEHSVEEFTDLGVATWVQSDGPQLEVNAPVEVAGIKTIASASFGGVIPTTPLTEDLVLHMDNTGDPYDACEAATNAAQLNGKIAVIRRGSCEFGCKAEMAQNAGAVAVIVVNNVAGSPIAMGEGTCGVNVSIPAVMISQAEGEALITELESGSTVNATLVDQGLEILQADYGDLIAGLDEDIIESSVKVYPNPANESAIITLHLSENQDVVIELVDLMGQRVSSRIEKDVEMGRTLHSMNTSTLSNGVYTVRLSAGSSMVTKRLVVQN